MSFERIIELNLAKKYEDYKQFYIKPNNKRGQSFTFTIYDEKKKPFLMAKFFDYLSGLELAFIDVEIKHESIEQLLDNIDQLEEKINVNYNVEQIINSIEFQKRCFDRYIKASQIENLNCFPTVISSDDNVKINNTFYGFLIEKYIDGQTLEELLPFDEEKKLEGTAFDFLYQMGLTIKRLVKHSIVHRDISPDNLMFSNQKYILIDPGIIKMENEGPATQSGMSMGKRYYSAPEQMSWNAKHTNFTSDLYSVGIIALEIILGYNPIKKMYLEGIRNPYSTLITKYNRNIEDEFFTRVPQNSFTTSMFKIIKKLVQYNEIYRYDSINTFIQALEILEERAEVND